MNQKRTVEEIWKPVWDQEEKVRQLKDAKPRDMAAIDAEKKKLTALRVEAHREDPCYVL